MIHVDRTRVALPAILRSKAAREARERLYEFFDLPAEHRAQRRFDFDKHVFPITRQLRPHVLELFERKCAYCESRIGDIATVDIEWFRPKGGSLNLDGSRAPDHYGWLALEWENIYAACPMCNRTKGSRFPVRGYRAVVGTLEDRRVFDGEGWSTLRNEAALLLDPCFDHPEQHLFFSADGSVAAIPIDLLEARERDRFGVPTRGQVTIDTFALNRTNLVEQRRNHAELLVARLAQAFPNPFRHLPAVHDIEKQLLTPDEPYLGMKRQVIEQWGRSHAVPDRPFVTPRRTRGAARPPLLPPPDETARERAVAEQQVREQRFLGASVEVASDAAVYRARAAYVERVEIAGVTVLDDLLIDASPGDSSTGSDAPWLMLLGENGSGKTSILRAIALALAGRRTMHGLQQGRLGSRLVELFADDGSVRVFLTSQSEPIEIRRRGSTLEVLGEPSGAKVFLRAYGPSRWFPQEGSVAAETDGFVRIESLFNPFVPLDPGEQSLTMLDPSKWGDVAGALERLLLLREGSIMPPAPGTPLAFRLDDGAPTPLRALSSGYEAMVAMTGDLAQMLYGRWGSLLDAEGIVLLDEIDAHLHPRWKMRIVESLRRAFPRMQFIASTHEPLCLRGLRAGEILVLHREGDTVTVERPSDDIAAMRVDQLLTSRLFGLYSTLDPALEAEFDRYYALLARHDADLSHEERVELAGLRSTVGSRGILGSSRRDQLIYRVIDELVAREPAMTSAAERAVQDRFTAEQVAEAWSRIPDLPEEEGGT